MDEMEFYVVYQSGKEYWTLELTGCTLIDYKFERWEVK